MSDSSELFCSSAFPEISSSRHCQSQVVNSKVLLSNPFFSVSHNCRISCTFDRIDQIREREKKNWPSIGQKKMSAELFSITFWTFLLIERFKLAFTSSRLNDICPGNKICMLQIVLKLELKQRNHSGWLGQACRDCHTCQSCPSLIILNFGSGHALKWSSLEKPFSILQRTKLKTVFVLKIAAPLFRSFCFYSFFLDF